MVLQYKKTSKTAVKLINTYFGIMILQHAKMKQLKSKFNYMVRGWCLVQQVMVSVVLTMRENN